MLIDANIHHWILQTVCIPLAIVDVFVVHVSQTNAIPIGNDAFRYRRTNVYEPNSFVRVGRLSCT